MEELLALYLQSYNKFEEITQSCSDCPFKKQCSVYKNPRDSYIYDYLMEVLIENISNEEE